MIPVSGKGVDLKGVRAAYGLSLICQQKTHGVIRRHRHHGKVDRPPSAFADSVLLSYVSTTLCSNRFEEARPHAFDIADDERFAEASTPASGKAILLTPLRPNHPRHLRFNA